MNVRYEALGLGLWLCGRMNVRYEALEFRERFNGVLLVHHERLILF